MAKDEEHPQLAKIRAFDRQMHIQKAIEAGLSREEAERHADDHLESWSPRQIEEREEQVEERES